MPKRNPTGYPDFTLPIGLLMQLIPVKLIPDWGAIEAEDVDLYGSAAVPSGSDTTIINYTVPNGKTLLIYDWSMAFYSTPGTLCAWIYNASVGVTLSVGGGNRGFQTPLTKPKRVGAGEQILLRVRQDEGAVRSIRGHLGGTLI